MTSHLPGAESSQSLPSYLQREPMILRLLPGSGDNSHVIEITTHTQVSLPKMALFSRIFSSRKNQRNSCLKRSNVENVTQ